MSNEDKMTVRKFKQYVRGGMLTDYDGFGVPYRYDEKLKGRVYPSTLDYIPDNCTHVVWYNK